MASTSEDFVPASGFAIGPGVTLSQQDNADEALDTLNGAMLHYDAHYAGATAWQRPLMVSTLTLQQRLIGMASKTYGRRRAILGFDDITMNGPLFGGDTLYPRNRRSSTSMRLARHPHGDLWAQGRWDRGRSHHLPHGDRAPRCVRCVGAEVRFDAYRMSRRWRVGRTGRPVVRGLRCG